MKMLKRTPFKNKYSTLKRTTGFKRSPFSSLSRGSRIKKFREVKGEDLEGEKVLQVHEADSLFSKAIRKRDGQCVNCGSTLFLGCSHYHGRSTYATRFNPHNCITLCQACHEIWEHSKNGIYKDYMIMWLGEEEFKALEERSKTKLSPYEAIINFMKENKKIVEETINY